MTSAIVAREHVCFSCCIVRRVLQDHWRPKSYFAGMGIVESFTVLFGSRFCFYGSVLSGFPKRFINDISWIRNYAIECVAELA